MGILLQRTNDALNINPPPQIYHKLSTNGSNWLWAVTAIFLLCFLLVAAHSFKAKQGEKVFHYLLSIALLVGTISYFAMASDLAWRQVSQHLNQKGGFRSSRQIFWAKYVYWVVAFPVVSIILGLISGVSWATMVFWVALAWIWVISYLVAAFTATSYKWGFYAFGTLSWILLSSSICRGGHRGAKRLDMSRPFMMVNGLTQLLWLFYPIAWGLSDGGNKIGVTPSLIFFGILDVLMLPVLSILVVLMARKWDYAKMNLYFTQYGRVRQSGAYPEKAPAAPGEQPAVVGQV